jgi:type II secretory ATPase GspE/PulE/Tfp pilus assembly ATPase PilB-like protein
MKTIESDTLVDAIKSLLDHFRDRMTGARQATRSQLVQYLAQQLNVTESVAAKLFDELRECGVVVRGDEDLLGRHFAGRDDQAWAIDTARTHLSTPQSWTEETEKTSESAAMDLIRRAIRHRATDVHLDPFGDEIEVRLRIDGRLEHYCRLSQEIGVPLIHQLKVLGELDPAERFHAQEGRLTLPVSMSLYDVRFTSTPVINRECVALRLLRRDQIIRPLDSLGLSNVDLHNLTTQMDTGEGIILVGGPAGSGKTTTLYSLVYNLENAHHNVVTIEDPVEYFVPGFSQIQVDTRHGLTLASGLKTALRMDPDVLLVGEIRDADTAAAALRAASCGKFVFSTLHTRDASSVLSAASSLNVDRHTLASNLRAIISQRLVRRLCDQCRVTRETTDEERAIFEREAVDVPDRISRAVGCKHCRGTGYLERIGVFEIVIVTPDLTAAIENGISERELRDLLHNRGVKNLAKDGLHKVREGFTTLEEVQAMNRLRR